MYIYLFIIFLQIFKKIYEIIRTLCSFSSLQWIYLFGNNITAVRNSFDTVNNHSKQINKMFISACDGTNEYVNYEMYSNIRKLDLGSNAITETSYPIAPCYEDSSSSKYFKLICMHISLQTIHVQYCFQY